MVWQMPWTGNSVIPNSDRSSELKGFLKQYADWQHLKNKTDKLLENTAKPKDILKLVLNILLYLIQKKILYATKKSSKSQYL